MKRRLSILMLVLFSAFALHAVVPVSRHVGTVNAFPESGSITARAIEAVRSGMTADWFEKYTTADRAMIDFWSDDLIAMLPLENVIAGMEKDNSVTLYDLDSHVLVSFTFNGDGLISSMDIER